MHDEHTEFPFAGFQEGTDGIEYEEDREHIDDIFRNRHCPSRRPMESGILNGRVKNKNSIHEKDHHRKRAAQKKSGIGSFVPANIAEGKLSQRHLLTLPPPYRYGHHGQDKPGTPLKGHEAVKAHVHSLPLAKAYR
ncbi:hypothetical protein ACP26L_30770 [Paenibacillus sp. S-38]|uniref:hypothetical protein n=1 Tax=Paenibacillus sp. S-38 TaxID=3416710 RepID=UPI003CF285CE